MSKTHTQQVAHCGMIVTLKNGKGRCPKCHDEIEADVKVKHARRSFRKQAAGRGRSSGDMVYDLGLLLLIAPLGLWFMGLWQNGLGSFRMDVFTLVVILALIGFAMVGGFGNGKKA